MSLKIPLVTPMTPIESDAGHSRQAHPEPERRTGATHRAVLALLLGGLALALLALWPYRQSPAPFLLLQSASQLLPARFWECVTTLGDCRVQLALLLPLCLRYPKLLWALLLGALCGALLSRGLKLTLAMPRPAAVLDAAQIVIIGSKLMAHSFPSGHTASAFACVLPLFVMFGRRAWPCLMLAALAGFSRIAVGAHWPVDVLAGALLGLLGGWAGLCLSRRWTWGARGMPRLALLGIAMLAVATLPVDGQGYPGSLPLRIAVCLWGLGGVAVILLPATKA